MATIFREQDEDYMENNIPDAFKDWISARNFCEEGALVNLIKISRMQIKAGLQSKTMSIMLSLSGLGYEFKYDNQNINGLRNILHVK